MATPYTEVFSRFSNKIKDLDWLKLTDAEIEEVCRGYIYNAARDFHACTKDLSEVSASGFVADLSSEELEILTDYMIISWINAEFINTSLALRQRLVSKDFHAFSPGNHLDKLLELRDKTREHAEHEMTVYSFGKNYAPFEERMVAMLTKKLR